MRRDLGKKFSVGEVLFQQGDPATCMYVIQKGQVEVVVESEYGEKHLASPKTGEVVGAVTLFAGKARFATVRAVTDTWVLTLDEKSFVSKLHRDPSLAFRLIRQMAHRIYDQDLALMHGFFDEKRRIRDVVGFISYIDLIAVLEKELDRAKRLWQILSFAIIDVDRFDIMDEKFHTTLGENLQDAFAETLRDTLRQQDVIGRFGEDQFGLLLYEADGQAAIRVLEKVHAALAALWSRFDKSEHVGPLFRCGIASYPEHTSPALLSKAAYKALLASKQTGNQILLAPPMRA